MPKALNALYLFNDCQTSKVFYNKIKNEFSRIISFKPIKTVAEAQELLASEEVYHFIFVDAALENYSPTEAVEDLMDISDQSEAIVFGETALVEKNIMTEIDQETLNEIHLFELPMEVSDIQEKLQNALIKFQLLEEEKAIISADESEFAPVKLRNFYLFNSIPADTYLRVSKDKFMKVIEKDEPFTEAMIQSFAKRKVRNFYLNKSDQLKLLEDSIKELLHKLDHKDQSTLKESLTHLIQSIGVIQTYLRLIGTGESVIKLTEKIIDRVREIFEETDSFKKVLKVFPLTTGDSSEKSALTTLFCESILKKMNYKSHATRSKLTLAAIICDSTLENEDLYKISTLEDPNLKMFSEQEQQNYKAHPNQAGELANLFPSISEVDFIIRQHHERPEGDGFPSGIHARKITTVSAIFIVANEFSTYLIQRGLDGKMISQGLKQLKNTYHVVPFKEPIRGLISSIKE